MSTNRQWLNRLKHCESPDSTYGGDRNPLVIKKAQGSTIWDVEGRSYLDFCAGFGALPLGHRHRSLLEILSEVGAHSLPVHGLGDVYASCAKVQLVERLAGLLDGPTRRVGLCLTGSQAIEWALKTAFLYTRKPGIIAFQGGYHGLDIGTLGVTDWPRFVQPFSGIMGVDFAAEVTRLEFGCDIDAFHKALSAKPNIGAVLLEPIQGRAGIVLPPSGWLLQVREFCSRHNLVLIADEIFTGLGRAGSLALSADLPADIICLGKALGGGFPVSACLATEAVMASWPESSGEAMHTGTFFGHALGCAVALRTLEVIENEKLTERSAQIGAGLKDRLEDFVTSLGLDWRIRGRGLMIAIDTRHAGQGAQLMASLRDSGVIALASGGDGRCLALTPALNVPEAHIEGFFLALKKAVSP